MAEDRSSSRSIQQTPSIPSMPAPAASLTTEQQLALALAALAESSSKMTALMEQQAEYNKQALKIAPRRRKTMAEYLSEKPRKYLKHDVYQNGRPVNPSGLSKDTIDLLDTLATGKYCDGLIDVVRISDGPGGVNSRIHIMYNNGSMEERMMFYMRFPTFTKIVTDVAAEMKLLGIKPVEEACPDRPQPEFPESL